MSTLSFISAAVHALERQLQGDPHSWEATTILTLERRKLALAHRSAEECAPVVVGGVLVQLIVTYDELGDHPRVFFDLAGFMPRMRRSRRRCATLDVLDEPRWQLTATGHLHASLGEMLASSYGTVIGGPRG